MEFTSSTVLLIHMICYQVLILSHQLITFLVITNGNLSKTVQHV